MHRVEPTGTGRPLPNLADAAWQRLQHLRAHARALGIEVDERWPIARLEQEIADAKATND